MLTSKLIDDLIKIAIREDIGHGDITSNAIEDNSLSIFNFIAKDEFIFCGALIAEKVFKEIDSSLEINFKIVDGATTSKNEILGTVKGKTTSILKGERTALNFLQRLSGIATNTDKFIKRLNNNNIKILDTRKTTPGHRVIQKYAVKVGGGSNHRYGLYDGVMLKDNHIDAAGGITVAIEKVRNNIPSTIKIEVETRSIEEVKEAVEAGADIIMLDNFKTEDIEKACKIINKKAKIEISGGVTLNNICNYLKFDIDYISIGALTHQAQSVDISLKFGGNI
jgi:nicotinate-nucleotide pyrophosphorylase (carboxylating)